MNKRTVEWTGGWKSVDSGWDVEEDRRVGRWMRNVVSGCLYGKLIWTMKLASGREDEGEWLLVNNMESLYSNNVCL